MAGTHTHHHDMKSDPIFEIKVTSTTAELADSVVTINNYCIFPFTKTELFWVVTQRVELISYWRFWTPEDGTVRLSENFGKKWPLLPCVTTQKSAVLICYAAEAWSKAFPCMFKNSSTKNFFFTYNSRTVTWSWRIFSLTECNPSCWQLARTLCLVWVRKTN